MSDKPRLWFLGTYITVVSLLQVLRFWSTQTSSEKTTFWPFFCASTQWTISRIIEEFSLSLCSSFHQRFSLIYTRRVFAEPLQLIPSAFLADLSISTTRLYWRSTKIQDPVGSVQLTRCVITFLIIKEPHHDRDQTESGGHVRLLQWSGQSHLFAQEGSSFLLPVMASAPSSIKGICQSLNMLPWPEVMQKGLKGSGHSSFCSCWWMNEGERAGQGKA